jgi:DNA polymerase elongation subunit (family B)
MKKEFLQDILSMEIKGLDPIRRENSKFVTNFLSLTLEFLLEKNTPFEIYNSLKLYLEKLLKNKIPLENFIMTCLIKSEASYKSPTAQRQLATRLNREANRIIFSDNDRMPYIHVVPEFLKNNFNNQNRLSNKEFFISTNKIDDSLKIDHLDNVRENKLLVDYEYYILALNTKLEKIIQFHSISQSIQQLFDEKLSLFVDKNNDIKKRKDNGKGKNKNKKIKTLTLEQFFKKK